MKTLGVDLASQAKHTGLCLLEWNTSECLCVSLEVGADNDEIICAARNVARVGIDAPVGWPKAFVAFIKGAAKIQEWNDSVRDRLRFRHTDFFVRECTGRWPLSVSSDLIGVVAMRCQTLLAHFAAYDETYPAAALKRWQLPSSGYKGKEGASKRKAILKQLQMKAPWLQLSSVQKQLCEENDNALDALLTALNARAVECGLTEPIPSHLQIDVLEEGWIAVPLPDSLEKLLFQ